MLRLTKISRRCDEVVLKVEGWVSDQGAILLAEEGMHCLREVRCLVLDLDGLQFIDATGLAVLKRWPKERLVLRGGSLFVRTLLQRHGLA